MTLYGGSLKLGSDGRLDLYTTGGGSFTAKQNLMMTGGTIGLNSGSGPTVTKPKDIALKSSSDTKKDSNGQWQVEPNKIKSVASIVPAHEPWDRKAGVASSASNSTLDTDNDGRDLESDESVDSVTEDTQDTATEGINGDTQQDTSGSDVTTDTGETVTTYSEDRDPGPYGATQEPLDQDDRADSSQMTNEQAPTVTEGTGSLDPLETKAVMIQAKNYLTSGDYSSILPNGEFGAYALDAVQCVESGIISRASLEQYVKNPNKALNDIASYTGKYGIKSPEEFLSSSTVQDLVMQDNMAANYKKGIANGAIRISDSTTTVGGMLSVMHTCGVDSAQTWRLTGQNTVDKLGNNAKKLFNLGTDAVKRLGRGP